MKPTCVDAVTKETLTPADQLFNVNSKIYQQLRGNSRVVICIDEIDKMLVNDPTNSILERLRDVRDSGKLLIRDGSNYKYLDVSRTIFVVISNETRESWNLPAVELSEIEKKSRTHNKRDVSLTNRFDIIEFEFLKAHSYKIIAEKELSAMKKYYAKDYDIDVQFDNVFIDKVAAACERVNKGVRGVNDYINQIRGKLVEYRSQNKNFKGTKITLDYDQSNDCISIKNG